MKRKVRTKRPSVSARPTKKKVTQKTETSQLLIKQSPLYSQGQVVGLSLQVQLIPYKKVGEQHAMVLSRDQSGEPDQVGAITTLQDFEGKQVGNCTVSSSVLELTTKQQRRLVDYLEAARADLVSKLTRDEIDRLITQKGK